MYKLVFYPKFLRKSAKLTKRNHALETDVLQTLQQLSDNPFEPSLHTHKVTDIDGNLAFSSKITGDLRVIWDFGENEIRVIELLDIGGHSGKNKVYR